MHEMKLPSPISISFGLSLGRTHKNIAALLRSQDFCLLSSSCPVLYLSIHSRGSESLCFRGADLVHNSHSERRNFIILRLWLSIHTYARAPSRSRRYGCHHAAASIREDCIPSSPASGCRGSTMRIYYLCVRRRQGAECVVAIHPGPWPAFVHATVALTLDL